MRTRMKTLPVPVLAGFLLLLALVLVTSPLQAEGKKKAIGMILETKGKVTLDTGRKALVMMPLYEGSKLETAKDSSVTYVIYATNKEYKLQAGSAVTLKNGEAAASRGKQDTTRNKVALALPKNTEVTSRRMMGALVRNQPVLDPYADEKIYSPTLTVTWDRERANAEKVKINITDRATGKDLPNFPVTVDNVPAGNARNSKGKIVDVSKTFTSLPLEYGKEYKVSLFALRKDSKGAVREVSIDPLYDLVVTYLPEETVKKIEDTRKQFNAYIEKNPKDIQAYVLMANFYEDLKLYRDAAAVAEKAIRLDPRNPYLYYYASNQYMKIGRYSASKELNDKGEALEKKIQGKK